MKGTQNCLAAGALPPKPNWGTHITPDPLRFKGSPLRVIRRVASWPEGEEEREKGVRPPNFQTSSAVYDILMWTVTAVTEDHPGASSTATLNRQSDKPKTRSSAIANKLRNASYHLHYFLN